MIAQELHRTGFVVVSTHVPSHVAKLCRHWLCRHGQGCLLRRVALQWSCFAKDPMPAARTKYSDIWRSSSFWKRYMRTSRPKQQSHQKTNEQTLGAIRNRVTNWINKLIRIKCMCVSVAKVAYCRSKSSCMMKCDQRPEIRSSLWDVLLRKVECPTRFMLACCVTIMFLQPSVSQRCLECVMRCLLQFCVWWMREGRGTFHLVLSALQADVMGSLATSTSSRPSRALVW